MAVLEELEDRGDGVWEENKDLGSTKATPFDPEEYDRVLHTSSEFG